jgi:hypothetical protein
MLLVVVGTRCTLKNKLAMGTSDERPRDHHHGPTHGAKEEELA